MQETPSLKFFKQELSSLANPEQAKNLQRFFKTGKGEYGEGDVFLGIKVPEQRKIAKKYDLGLTGIQELLNSKIHEERLIGLFILIKKFKKANKHERGEIFKFYLKNTKNINNWDLVDLSAPNISGVYLLENPEIIPLLDKLAISDNLWERRISIISTFIFIREEKHLDVVLRLAKTLLNDKHDLIHKAVGWMLRELGKKDLDALECFLRANLAHIPRTMLRYAIEKFPEEKRKEYLSKPRALEIFK